MSKPTSARHISEHATLTSYVTGFVFSIALTVLAYIAATQHTLSRRMLISTIAGLAVTQFLVQLVFFLHLGRETKPRWKLLVFGLMILVVAILVIGSLWIMYNLNYNMMSPSDMNGYLHDQDGL